MKRSTASRGAFAILVALPLLPVCGIVLHGEPAMVFFMGAMSFILESPHPSPLPEGEGGFFVGTRVPWAYAHGYIISPLRGCRGEHGDDARARRRATLLFQKPECPVYLL